MLALLEFSRRVNEEVPFLVSPSGMGAIPIPTEIPGDLILLMVLVLANPPPAVNHPEPDLEGGAGCEGLPDMASGV